MNSIGFALLAAMVTIYVLLDGYDLGTATISPFLARTSQERGEAMRSIGPFWNGNEVWLIATGGVLFALFPQAYASAFSAFYLPFTIVLWMLMFRGLAMELRNHFTMPMWRDFWDFAFSASSALLVLLFGVALGNLVRGVPLNASGYLLGTLGFLLNPYALCIGVLALVALALHGALWLAMMTSGAPARRARGAVPALTVAVAALYLAASAATWSVHAVDPQRRWIVALPLICLGALAGVVLATRRGATRWAFVFSSAFLAGLLAGAATALYPFLIPSLPRGGGISIQTMAGGSVAVITFVAIAGLVAVIAYTIFVVRAMSQHAGDA
ncbi:MAG TPA: cytochrome d ubiquinol oxidase subunit II [Candidatus Baltobacteraceae bacterium]